MITFIYTLYRFGRGIRAGLHDPEFQALLWLAVSILAVGTVTYHYTEGWGWVDALYFSVSTLTTLGVAGLQPTSVGSKLFTILYLLVGIGILLGFVNALAEHAVRDTKERPGLIGRRIITRRKDASPMNVVPDIPADPARQEMQDAVEKADAVR